MHPAFDARVRVCSLRPDAMGALEAWVDETKRLWAAELGAFKAYLEGG